MASGGSITSCQVTVTEPFIFGTPETQLGAEMIYQAKKTELANSISGAAQAPSVRHDVKLLFKTDYERMQYIMGLYGRTAKGLR